jgi:hypothetical protein
MGCGTDNGSTAPGQAAGRAVFHDAGCLACHRLGHEGNDGPGPDLSGIGARLPSAGIAEALRNPAAPMPSFARIPAAGFAALVAFLAAQRGPSPIKNETARARAICGGSGDCRRLIEVNGPQAVRFHDRLASDDHRLSRDECAGTAHALSGALRAMITGIGGLPAAPARDRLRARFLAGARRSATAARAAADAVSRGRLMCGARMRERVRLPAGIGSPPGR